MYEKNVHAQLVNYFAWNTLFTDTQYSYRSGCSTEFASMVLTNGVYNHPWNCKVPFAVFLDLSKAFDTLYYNI